MHRICPNPIPWHEAFQRLSKFAQSNRCTPAQPPKPLILAGWAHSNDVEKRARWEETVTWAAENGCNSLVETIYDADYYVVETPTTNVVGPLGGPMYRAWDYAAKNRLTKEQLIQLMQTLQGRWSEIAGAEVAIATRPLGFTGERARRLLVLADNAVTPPWGGWACLAAEESKRRAFTRFRAAINSAIKPHEVDHIDFTTQNRAGRGSQADSPACGGSAA